MSIEDLGLSGIEVTPAGTLVIGAPTAQKEETEDVHRRDFLKYCGVVGATALVGGSDQLAHALGGPHQEHLVDDLLALTRGYVQQWGTTSPTVLLPAVRTHLGVLQALSACSLSPSLAQRLWSVTSETAAVAGWLSVLLQNVGDGRAYYGLARDLAREAGDGPRLALALGAASSTYSPASRAGQGGDPALALHLLQEAAIAAGDHAAPQMLSWLHVRQAEECAAVGDAYAVDRHLDRAQSALGAASAQGDGLFGAFDLAWLSGFQGSCALLLDRPEQAATILEATRASDLGLTSQRSAVLTDLAAAYARQGEVEHACSLMADSVAVAAQSHFAELVQRVMGARHQLAAWDGTPAVRQLDDQLRTVAYSLA